MKVLFAHSNFPAQFVNIASYMGRNRDRFTPVFLTARQEGSLGGVVKALFAKNREAARETHNYVRNLEQAVLEGQAAYRTAMQLKNQ